MQTDTRTKVRFSHIIIYLIEPFEDTLYLLPVESDAVIRHSYFKDSFSGSRRVESRPVESVTVISPCSGVYLKALEKIFISIL